MKAQVDENGKLSVIPETPVESYALMQWWKGYMKLQGETAAPCDVTLEICNIERAGNSQ